MPLFHVGIPTICFVLVFRRIIVIRIEIILFQIIVHLLSNSDHEKVYSLVFLTLVLLCPSDLLWHRQAELERALIFASIPHRPGRISSVPGLHIPGEPVRGISTPLLPAHSYPGERSDECCHPHFLNRKIC